MENFDLLKMLKWKLRLNILHFANDFQPLLLRRHHIKFSLKSIRRGTHAHTAEWSEKFSIKLISNADEDDNLVDQTREFSESFENSHRMGPDKSQFNDRISYCFSGSFHSPRMILVCIRVSHEPTASAGSSHQIETNTRNERSHCRRC